MTLASGVPAVAATYSGTLAQPGVAWISDDSHPAAIATPDMRNSMKSFMPDLIIVTVGSSVRFPNDDPFYHSIYSSGPPDPFDIGFYDNGPGKTVEFDRAGVVNVRCHIHGIMHGAIVVVDGPWVQTHAPGEHFTLAGVRPGTHTLHLWMPGSDEKTESVKL